MPNLPAEGNINPLNRALRSLGRMTSVLRIFAIAIATSTLSVLFYGTFIFLLRSRLPSGTSGNYYSAHGFLADNIDIFVVVAFFSIFLILLREFYWRKGDAIFEEIGDELAAAKSPEETEFSPLETRLVLRSFAHAVDLPLVPGKFGALVYFVINVLMVFFVVFR